ncbi:DNA-binding Xre family transcriptional regulator [Pedobacter sp. AK013]|uniref:helix-turn-helix domain-containing protein n=1 Tax=Pedobacter sp. AK013 TaxID=2723071 RepID=UPI001834DECA|nr:helix-turn-helix transcriptional regulator [Pedobacter sp. AK013]MBB6240194.1 DNA-binding Xre family transcriptional regulator [Pedobacter sp. AK013]
MGYKSTVLHQRPEMWSCKTLIYNSLLIIKYNEFKIKGQISPNIFSLIFGFCMVGKQYRDQEYLVKIGKRIVEIRDLRKITQEKLAELTEIDTRQIGRIERAETNVSISSLKLIADHLKISVSDLLDFSKSTKK